MRRSILALVLALFFIPTALVSQSTMPYAPTSVSVSDYARAEQFAIRNAERLTSGTAVNLRWVDSNRFWYRNQVFGGHEFIIVDIAARTRKPVFDHTRLAAALSRRTEMLSCVGR